MYLEELGSSKYIFFRRLAAKPSSAEKISGFQELQILNYSGFICGNPRTMRTYTICVVLLAKEQK